MTRPFLCKIKIINNINGDTLQDFGFQLFINEADKEQTIDLFRSEFIAENPGLEFSLICENVNMGYSPFCHEVIIEGEKCITN